MIVTLSEEMAFLSSKKFHRNKFCFSKIAENFSAFSDVPEKSKNYDYFSREFNPIKTQISPPQPAKDYFVLKL